MTQALFHTEYAYDYEMTNEERTVYVAMARRSIALIAKKLETVTPEMDSAAYAVYCANKRKACFHDEYAAAIAASPLFPIAKEPPT